MEEVMNFIANLFVGNGIVIAVCSYVVGEVIKSLGFIDKKFIPLVGAIIGVLLGVAIPGCFEGESLIVSGIMGMALGWAATGAFETFKNLKNKASE